MIDNRPLENMADVFKPGGLKKLIAKEATTSNKAVQNFLINVFTIAKRLKVLTKVRFDLIVDRGCHRSEKGGKVN